jgi:hypothetical protein
MLGSGLVQSFERDVIVVQKRQWPHAGTSLGPGGGAFFYFLNILEAFFACGVNFEI